jgi:hypothetical protein
MKPRSYPSFPHHCDSNSNENGHKYDKTGVYCNLHLRFDALLHHNASGCLGGGLVVVCSPKYSNTPFSWIDVYGRVGDR